MEKYYTYILQSKKDNSFYIGQTNDLDVRMSKHNDGLNPYTKTRRPWKLVYFEKFSSRSEAIKRERNIKMRKSRKYIQSLIENKFALPII